MGLFTKDITTLEDLFAHGFKDIYYAENQILKALPKLIEAATNPQLKRALRTTEGNRGAGLAARADLRDARGEAKRHQVPWHQRAHQRRRRADRQYRRQERSGCRHYLMRRKPSSTTRSPATAPSSPGLAKWAAMISPISCRKISMRNWRQMKSLSSLAKAGSTSRRTAGPRKRLRGKLGRKSPAVRRPDKSP